MEVRLSDTELEVMGLLWERGETAASELAALLGASRGWEKSTVYTLLTRLIRKGAVEKSGPGYLCRPVAKQGDVRRAQARNLLQKLYGGSLNLLVRGFVEDRALSKQEIDELKALLDTMEDAP